MKFVLLTLIAFYKTVLSPLFVQGLGIKASCRYSPTCSTYAKEVIEKQGAWKGMGMALQRLLSCQPFAKSYGYR